MSPGEYSRDPVSRPLGDFPPMNRTDGTKRHDAAVPQSKKFGIVSEMDSGTLHSRSSSLIKRNATATLGFRFMISASSQYHRLSNLKAALIFSAATLLSLSPGRAVNYERSDMVPPRLVREFRGVWIATVANIDWPSESGLSTASQQQELLGILDRAVQLKLNAVIFQVRPACDAMYASSLEPWSEYLTGTMGRAPVPFYDPLAFALDQAHRRGLELHAWFNPYRALHKSHAGGVSPNHISRTRPQLVKRCGDYLWLDPGEREVQDYALSVVMDVVKRYDIDGVHFDDYFYPDRGEAGADPDFPDNASWMKSGMAGKMSRDDWRRGNVNAFIERVYNSIKAAKPWVKFGVSPHGIWRPGHPPQIKGFDSYARIYADSRKWLATGWVDYFAPQLYWPIESREQNFPLLLNWWAQQNLKSRHLWPGLAAYKAEEWAPEEIPNQIRLARKQFGVTGCALFNASSLYHNQPLMEKLKHELNTESALMPASPWLSTSRPANPVLSMSGLARGQLRLWIGESSLDLPSRWWLLQTCSDGKWTTEILPGATRIKVFDNAQPDVIAVTRIDRFGNASEATVLKKQTSAPDAHEIRPAMAPVPPEKKKPVKSLNSPHEHSGKQ